MTEIKIDEVYQTTNTFLGVIWGKYVSSEPLYYEIYCKNEKGRSIIQFFEGPLAHREATKWLVENYDMLVKKNYHVWYGVLPRIRKPKKGRRGKTSDVDRGLWLWADIDYKTTYKDLEKIPIDDELRKEAREKGYAYRELEDYALIGIYRDGEEWRFVNRPPLSQVIEEIRSILGIEPTIVIDSGCGYHFYFKLMYEITAKDLEKMERKLVDILGADKNSKDLARVLRLPGSINPRLNRLVNIILFNDNEYDPEEISRVLDNIETKETKKSRKARETIRQKQYLRVLKSEEITRATEILKKYYIGGHRQNIWLFVSGWAVKSRIHPSSILDILYRLYRDTGDSDPLSTRISAIVYTYKKTNLWNEQVKSELKQKVLELGIDKVYGEEFIPTKEYEIAGKSKLIEELIEIMVSKNPELRDEEIRDRVIEDISELEKILGPRRSKLISVPYESNKRIVNDPRRGIVLLVINMDNDGNIRRRRKYISDWYISKVKINYGNGQIIYKILFVSAKTKQKLTLSGNLLEIANELMKIHGVTRSRVVRDAMSALIPEFIRRNLAKIYKKHVVSGIMPIKDGVKLVRTGILSSLLVPSKEELDIEKAKRALKLLTRMRNHYDSIKFDVAINWTGYAPASYVLKTQFDIKQLYILLHGERQTGKTSLARVITSLFPVRDLQRGEMIPEEGQSPHRLATKLDITSAPILEDEIQGISHNKQLQGLIKRAATSKGPIRWRGDTNRFYYARAALIMTSNYREMIEDPALLERIISIEFTKDDYVYDKSREQLEEFKKIYNEYLSIAPHLGRVILDTIIELWPEIKEKWVHRLITKQDYLEFGKWIWIKVAEKLGIELPTWCESEIKIEEEMPEHREREMLFELLHDVIREAILRGKQYITSTDLWGKIKELDKVGLLPGWIHVRSNDIVVSKTILEELRKRYNYTPIGGLKQMAARLGYKYYNPIIKGRSVRGMVIPYRDLIDNIATIEEKAEKLAEKYEAEFKLSRKLEEKEVLNVLMEKEGLELEEAMHLARLVYEKLKDRMIE